MGVIWNQWARPISSDYWEPYIYDTAKISVTFSDGIATCEWLAQYRFHNTGLKTKATTNFPIGDKYYCSYMINPSVNGLRWGMDAGNVVIYGAATNVPANIWTQVSAVVINTRVNNHYYINYCSSELTDIPIGMTAQNKCPIFINLTQMFGAGKEPTKAQFEYMCALNNIDLTSALPYDEGTEIDWIDSVPSAYELRRRIILNEPHLITPAAAPLQNFVTDLKAPLKSCKVSFLPVQEGSGDPSPDNVRPISGWTGLKVQCTGKNLLDPTTIRLYSQYFQAGNWGTVSWSDTSLDGSLFLPNGTFYWGVSRTGAGLSPTEWKAFDKNNNNLFHAYTYGYSCSFTNPETQNIGLYLSAKNLADFNIFKDTMQLELGSQATTYEPYTGSTIPVDWTNDAGEIFGGYVDLAKGELAQTYTKVLVTKNLTSWNTWGSTLMYNNSYMSNRKAKTIVYSDTLTPIGGTMDPQKVTSMTEIRYYGNDVRYPQYLFMANPDKLSVADWRTWLVETYPNASIVFELTTPIIYTLTPLQIKTLLGTNNIYANTNGDVQVTYWKH